ncbi:GNAT family N-acetyltransferase [Pandoraea apista]|nr:GNAT family N-acetyltransferase [Pandoraea apista]
MGGVSEFGTCHADGGDYVVEALADADRRAVARLYYEVRVATMTWLDPSTFGENDFALHSAGEEVLVAKSDDGSVLGFVSVWRADEFIHMLYVRQSSQGSGVGARLLQALPGWPGRRYRLKCLVRNTRASAFYARHGFRVTGHGVSDEGEYEEMTFAGPRN